MFEKNNDLISCILADREALYNRYEYGPFRLTVGRGVDLDAPYYSDQLINNMTVRERIQVLGEGVQFEIIEDRNFAFAYLMESIYT